MPQKRISSQPRPIRSVPSTKVGDQDIIDTYKCHWCGKRCRGLDKNFPASQSELYAGWDYHLPICRKCIEKLYEHYVRAYDGDENAAIRRICSKYDIYYSEDIVNSALVGRSCQKSPISVYLSRSCLNQYKGKTFDTTLDEERLAKVSLIAEDEPEEVTRKSARNIKRWGTGYTEEEYEMLNEHYKLYKDSIDENNATQIALLNDLCEQYVLKMRARQNGDIDRYEKVSKLYQQTLGSASLKPKSTADQVSNNPDECWGNFIKTVETMSPAEYFEDKSIFKDYDEQDEYYRRFVERSTNNLMNGTSIMDDEYSIKDDIDDQ